jgi:hypothetical protein
MNNSGSYPAEGDDGLTLQGVDAYASTFGTTLAFPAGNSGPSRSVHEPCIAYNTLCMGAFDYWGTEDPADDRMASFSSRGPTPGGRKKPDLVGVGITQYAERQWQVNGLWSWDQEGTSFASPQGAGAAALLAGSGLTDPNMQKAVLINSSRLGRSDPAQPMGTQITWQPDWGWGALDLGQALIERTNGVGSSVPGGSARFFRASGVSAADRATLVWQRRATGCYAPGCYPSAMTLTDLDLQQLDPTTGAVQAQSNSAIDNVEQVRSPGAAATAIYKVKASSTVDGLNAEPFAVTARRPLTPLAAPQPTVTIDVDAGTERINEPKTVTATVRNPSPDLTAENVTVTLELPATVELVSGAQVRSLGTLPTNSAPQTFTWTVKGTTDGLKNLIARAEASRYGESFTAAAADSYTVDATPPAPSIATPPGSTSNALLGITWGATDAHSTIAAYDVEVAIDGGAWTPWLTSGSQTQATYAGAANHRYRFRVRAIDALGNVSAWLESGETTVTDPPSATPVRPDNPIVIPPPTLARKTPTLRLARISRTKTRITITGRVDRTATGRVTLGYSAKVKRKTHKARTVTARVGRGRFSATIKLPAKLRSPRRGTLAIRYGGDAHFAPRALKRTLTAR